MSVPRNFQKLCNKTRILRYTEPTPGVPPLFVRKDFQVGSVDAFAQAFYSWQDEVQFEQLSHQCPMAT
jgi:hypothetical protein